MLVLWNHRYWKTTRKVHRTWNACKDGIIRKVHLHISVIYFQPARVIKPKIESGADKRTKSQVCFGEPSLADEYYETTTHSVFKPVSVPYTYERNNLNTKSVVPLDYYGK